MQSLRIGGPRNGPLAHELGIKLRLLPDRVSELIPVEDPSRHALPRPTRDIAQSSGARACRSVA